MLFGNTFFVWNYRKIEIISNIMKRSYSAIVTRSQLHNIKSTYLPRWSKEEVNNLIAYKEQGFCTYKISTLLGRTHSGVRNKWDKMQKKV